MASTQITTREGETITLDEEALLAMQGQLRGALLRAEDPEYETARKLWNGMIDKKPALIARCSGVADVMAAVNFARDRQLRFSVRPAATMFPVQRFQSLNEGDATC